MAYDADSDTYACANGKTLSVERIRRGKTSSGFPIETTVYSCAATSRLRRNGLIF